MRRSLLAALCALVALAVAPQAQAAGGSSLACPDSGATRPFLRFLDPIQYFLAPNGGFEQGSTGWTLTGGARVVSGNESFSLRSTADRYSLSLPSGSSATSSPVCAAPLDSVMRFVAVNNGSLLTPLAVEAIYTNILGQRVTHPIGVAAGTGAWLPSLPTPMLANLLSTPALLDGTHASVQLRFRPVGMLSGWRIDDVYVDPFLSR